MSIFRLVSEFSEFPNILIRGVRYLLLSSNNCSAYIHNINTIFIWTVMVGKNENTIYTGWRFTFASYQVIIVSKVQLRLQYRFCAIWIVCLLCARVHVSCLNLIICYVPFISYVPIGQECSLYYKFSNIKYS